MVRMMLIIFLLFSSHSCFGWGFYAHRKINYLSVFLLPPEMLIFYKQHLSFLEEHAVDPDKRRYAVPEEGPRHYIDLDRYGSYPFDSLPRKWEEAVAKYLTDTIQKHGIVPWWIETMRKRLTAAFRSRETWKILRLSAELGHYISDAHVPLHACSNHNGQYTNQRGIHGLWESRLPELLAETEWDFFIGRAAYLDDPSAFIWKRVLESAAASDTVLKWEKSLSARFPADKKYAYENRNGKTIHQYSAAYSIAYDRMMQGMVERRMRASIFAIASFWFTAWIDAGQPALNELAPVHIPGEELVELEKLNLAWKQGVMIGRKEEDHD